MFRKGNEPDNVTARTGMAYWLIRTGPTLVTKSWDSKVKYYVVCTLQP